MDLVAEPILVAASTLGEGPHWDAGRRVLWWVDILGSALHAFDPAAGVDRVWAVGDHVGTVVPSVAGGVVLALRRGLAAFDPEADGPPRMLAEPADHPASNRFNDGTCDPAGRLWAGTMAYDEATGAGALYRFDADHRLHRVLDGITISNGLAWDLERSVFYHIDSPTRTIRAFSYDHASGAIAEPRTAVRCGLDDGFPDGMAIDVEGMLWVAHWGGAQVVRWDPATGRAVQRVRVPTRQPSACAFGGDRLDRLFITSARVGLAPGILAAEPAGALFAIDVDVRGFASVPFAG